MFCLNISKRTVRVTRRSFFHIFPSIARPENNAKKGSAAGRELQGTDLKAYRGTTKICDAVIHVLQC